MNAQIHNQMAMARELVLGYEASGLFCSIIQVVQVFSEQFIVLFLRAELYPGYYRFIVIKTRKFYAHIYEIQCWQAYA